MASTQRLHRAVTDPAPLLPNEPRAMRLLSTLLRGRPVVLGLALLLAACAGAGNAQAQSPNDSVAVVSWEAVGDDGMSGRATRYELRYRTTAITGTDTLGWWNGATSLGGLPAPSNPGVTDSVVVRGLSPAASYYFMVRVADEVPNWSGFSNLVSVAAAVDGVPPAPIRDLRVDDTTPALRSDVEGSEPPKPR